MNKRKLNFRQLDRFDLHDKRQKIRLKNAAGKCNPVRNWWWG